MNPFNVQVNLDCLISNYHGVDHSRKLHPWQPELGHIGYLPCQCCIYLGSLACITPSKFFGEYGKVLTTSNPTSSRVLRHWASVRSMPANAVSIVMSTDAAMLFTPVVGRIISSISITDSGPMAAFVCSRIFRTWCGGWSWRTPRRK